MSLENELKKNTEALIAHGQILQAYLAKSNGEVAQTPAVPNLSAGIVAAPSPAIAPATVTAPVGAPVTVPAAALTAPAAPAIPNNVVPLPNALPAVPATAAPVAAAPGIVPSASVPSAAPSATPVGQVGMTREQFADAFMAPFKNLGGDANAAVAKARAYMQSKGVNQLAEVPEAAFADFLAGAQMAALA